MPIESPELLEARLLTVTQRAADRAKEYLHSREHRPDMTAVIAIELAATCRRLAAEVALMGGIRNVGRYADPLLRPEAALSVPAPTAIADWCWWEDAQGQRRLVEFLVWFGKLPQASVDAALKEFCEEAGLENWNFQFGERRPTGSIERPGVLPE
jgi:hypothetical protein